MSDFSSFAEAGAAALSQADSTGANAPANVEQPASGQSSQPAPAQAQPSVDGQPQTQAQPEQPAAPSTHKVKVRGEELEVSYEELVNGYSRQADYTRSKQELAQVKEQLVNAAQEIQARQQQFRQMEQILTNPQEFAKYAQHIGYTPAQTAQIVQNAQAQAAQAGLDPTDFAQMGDVQALLEKQVQGLQKQIAQVQAQFSQQTAKQLQLAEQKFQTMSQAQKYGEEINSTISNIFEKHPVLTDIEGVEEILRFKVHQAEPATLEEAKALFVQFGQEQAKKIMSRLEAAAKANVVAEKTLVTEGIEPPGGIGQLTQQPRNYDFGSDELKAGATQYLESLMRARSR